MAAGLEAYLSWYARIVGSVISAIDSHVVVSGNRIVGPMFSIRIVQTCDAMEVTILLVAALAAFPMPWLVRYGRHLPVAGCPFRSRRRDKPRARYRLPILRAP